MLNRILELDEAFGNYKNIFDDRILTFEDFSAQFEKSGRKLKVNPLSYFKNVGNGMNPEKQREEIERIIPDSEKNSVKRAEIAIQFILNGNHLGVSSEQYKKDLAKGKDHDATMVYFLQKIINGQPLEPCIVICSPFATRIFGDRVDKVILDGTHRAVVAAVVNIELDLIEFSLY